MRTVCLCLSVAILLAAPVPAEDGQPQPAPAGSGSGPGYLDVIESTAVELNGRIPEGTEVTRCEWKIVEGEGAQLYGSDQPTAVFLAPAVERGVKEFVVELTVHYKDEPPSTRRLRIRVAPADPTAAQGSSEDDLDWLQDIYRRERAADEQKQRSSPSVVVPYSNSPSVSIGVGVGPGGFYGGGIGFRWYMSYPVTQPVDVPPPGQTHLPGEGSWASVQTVPYRELSEKFPESVSTRYTEEGYPDTCEDPD